MGVANGAASGMSCRCARPLRGHRMPTRLACAGGYSRGGSERESRRRRRETSTIRTQSGGRTLRRCGRAFYHAQVDEMLACHVLPHLPERGHAPAPDSHFRAVMPAAHASGRFGCRLHTCPRSCARLARCSCQCRGAGHLCTELARVSWVLSERVGYTVLS